MSNSTPIVVADGPHRFLLKHDWGRLPDHIIWGKTHAVVIDSRQRVYIAHTSCDASPCRDTIVIFDHDGNFLSSWGADYFGHAHGLLLHREPDGREVLYLTDDSRGVFKTTLDGAVLQHIGKPDFFDREQRKFGPANVAIAANGDVFLVEGYGASLVLRFDRGGKLLHTFGGRGDEPHHTKWAHGILIAEVDGQPLLHIAVDEPSAIKRFTLDGLFHSLLPGEFLHPRNIIPNPQGNLWAIPEMQGRLTLLDPRTGASAHLGHWAKSMPEIFELRRGPRETFPSGRFVSAHGAAFFPNGDMIVTEWVEVGRVSKLSRLP